MGGTAGLPILGIMTMTMNVDKKYKRCEHSFTHGTTDTDVHIDTAIADSRFRMLVGMGYIYDIQQGYSFSAIFYIYSRLVLIFYQSSVRASSL